LKQYRVLDCTLRDGGYINRWEFSPKIANAIHQAVSESKIELLECGYLTQEPHENATLFGSVEACEKYFEPSLSEEGIGRVLMINQGDYDVDRLPEAGEKTLFGIRLAFHKKNMMQALEDATTIIQKGYRLFFQPMVAQSYSAQEYEQLIEKTNQLNPYAFYIVDSFGSMDNKDFMKFLSMVDTRLSRHIIIGFHGHNNMQFVYANAISLLENTSKQREIIIDASIYGMGRGAGNLNSEIIAEYLNKYYAKTYRIEPLLEVMDDYLEEIYLKTPWGFSAAHFLSARHQCHPNYASYLTAKKKLAISDINAILSQISHDQKNSFSQAYIEHLYTDFNAKQDTHDTFDPDVLLWEDIVLIGSGKSTTEYLSDIRALQSTRPCKTLLLNRHDERLSYDYVLFSNQKRFNEYIERVSDISKVIATSNIQTGERKIKKLDYTHLLEPALRNYDNVLILALSLLAKHHFGHRVYLAGIDGYDTHKDNYADEAIVLSDQKQMAHENQNLSMGIRFYGDMLAIHFVTPSIFHDCEELKVIGVIPARYKSSRFEGKPLCLIGGIPMIKRTYTQAKKSRLLDKLVVATDDQRIAAYCHQEKIPVVMTSEACLTGTDRIAEVSKIEHFDLYVNIQGDEPVIDPAGIDEIIEEYRQYGDAYIAYNLYKVETNADEIDMNTSIKVITNEKDELMYMSRHPVPFSRSHARPVYKRQVCIYGFTKKALELFAHQEKTHNERYEDIEILRFLDMGYKVKMKETSIDSIAVDIPADVQKVERYLQHRGLA
jgi:3-deoxy-D-manno-octulosonate cytidylyltransferase